MSVYLPIAEMPVNAVHVILLSGVIGFLSGMVGVGGGFILTPALLFMGLPPSVAVATQSSQITAASLSGAFAHFRSGNVDFRMGALLSVGGVLGTTLGVSVFAFLDRRGQFDVFVTILYVVLLSAIGGLMSWESVRALRRRTNPLPPPSKKVRRRSLAQRLPLRVRFPRSGLYLSVLPILAIGIVTSALGAMMGVGGGFLMVPAMIYLLRMPANLVVGTSLLSIAVAAGLATFQHALQRNGVDLILAVLLMGGGVLGAQFGARTGARLKTEHLRIVFGLLVLLTGLWLLADVLMEPRERFSIET